MTAPQPTPSSARRAEITWLAALLAGALFASIADATPPRLTPRLRAFVADYHRLRNTPGQYTGGSYNPVVDDLSGAKYTAMDALRLHFTQQRWRCTDVEQVLGAPDRRTAGSRPNRWQIIYFWRGMHDYVSFFCVDGVVNDTEWWNAGM